MNKIPFLVLLFNAFSCGLVNNGSPANSSDEFNTTSSYKTIGEIKVPDGCKRIPVQPVHLVNG